MSAVQTASLRTGIFGFLLWFLDISSFRIPNVFPVHDLPEFSEDEKVHKKKSSKHKQERGTSVEKEEPARDAVAVRLFV